ncbi:MAG: hypothetical protein IJ730_00280 [Alphaproteobacteria bacterium]|nr:hypothetical protein [Alphaproteobacteria bacterium]
MFVQKVLYPNNMSFNEKDFGFLKNLITYDCFSIVDLADNLKFLNNSELTQWLQADEFLIIGTGGSSLGAQCIYEIAKANLKNPLRKNIQFLSNLDPQTFQTTISHIKHPERVRILCISKSGETLETITQLLLIMDFFKNYQLSSKIVIITENKSSSLKQIAIDNNFLCFDHPKTIGGRFSVFSIVGMLPALICGINPNEIYEGAQNILHGDMENIKKGAAFVFQNFKNKITNHVSFIYSDKLKPFAEWLAQLYAESSGKDGIGITPIAARGSVDQHSQLQLYLDGTRDKCFSFFYEKQNCDFTITNNVPNKFNYLAQKNISEIFEAQCDATIKTLIEKKFNLRKFELSEITPKILGALFMHFMIEVSSVCKLMEVNPFDQPAVERGKIITKALLNGAVIC